MARQWQHLLATAVANPNAAIDSLSLFAEAELRELLSTCEGPQRTLPASWNGMVPVERPTPNCRYQSAPRAMIAGAQASVSTLLMTVGQPNRPDIAGSGGLARTMPRRPSRLSSIAVSSPHT